LRRLGSSADPLEWPQPGVLYLAIVQAGRRRRDPGAWRTVLGLVALLGLIAACSSSKPNARSTAAPGGGGFGPFVAGTTTVSLPTTSSKVVVWYPADPQSSRGHPNYTYDIRDWLPPSVARRVTPRRFTYTTDAYQNLPPSRSGPFPLILFAHGLYSFPDQSTFLTSWLASWGYVVAAPDLPIHDLAAFYDDRGRPAPTSPSDEDVLADTEQLMRQMNTEPANPFAGVIRPGKIGIIGHSQGGIDAMQFALRPEVGTYIPMAAGFLGAHPALAAIPSLYLAGGADHDILASWVQAVYVTAPQPKRLVVLAVCWLSGSRSAARCRPAHPLR
jgi:dienelactone hydrolase